MIKLNEVGKFGYVDDMTANELIKSVGVPRELEDSYVGIFWAIGNKVYVYRARIDSKEASVAPADLQDSEEDLQIDFDDTHKIVWKSQGLDELYGGVPYDYYPRGRILYKVKSKKFAIHTSKIYPQLSSPEFIRYLCTQFNIPYDFQYIEVIKDYGSQVDITGT